MKNLYDRFVLPRLVHAACRVEALSRERASLVPGAAGRVLEIGFGSGLNLPYYDPVEVEHVWALEPAPEMWKLAQKSVAATPIPVEHVQAPAEEIPLPDDSADTVLVTFSLCTVPDLPRALQEVRRVLKKGGRMLFCEHGASTEARVLRWQNRLDPFWTRIAGGCHLNRRIAALLAASGFEVRDLSTGYVDGWKIDSFLYRGQAVPASIRARTSRSAWSTAPAPTRCCP